MLDYIVIDNGREVLASEWLWFYGITIMCAFFYFI